MVKYTHIPKLKENKTKSYGSASDNMLIHGDNLTVLTTLLPRFSKKVKCIVIDSSFNTGGNFKYFPSATEHVEWLASMRQRVDLLKEFLADDGFFICFISDIESHYLKVLLDEALGRENYLMSMYVRAAYKDRHGIDPRLPWVYKIMEQAFVYAKSPDTRPYLYAGRIPDFYDSANLGDRTQEGEPFAEGKKPEKLMQIILQHFSAENDLVLDCFLGSGTTACVAQKMNRRWIGIESGVCIHTHCLPRLRKVIDGIDANGITSDLSWYGGGGFKFYEPENDE